MFIMYIWDNCFIVSIQEILVSTSVQVSRGPKSGVGVGRWGIFISHKKKKLIAHCAINETVYFRSVFHILYIIF